MITSSFEDSGLANATDAGMIVEVLGESDAPPYVVRWPDGHESLFIGSTNAVVDHAVHCRQSAA